MLMYDLEEIKNESIFIDLIANTYREQNLDEVLKLIKKSGFFVDFFGSGNPKNEPLYKKVIETVYGLISDTDELKKLEGFQSEVTILNGLYKKVIDDYVKPIEDTIPENIHVSSYIIALELFLSHDIYRLKYKSELNNNRSDYFENVAESSGNVLQYLLKYKKLPLENSALKIDFEMTKAAFLHIKSSEYREILDILREVWSYFEVDINKSDIITAISKGERTLGKQISHMKFLDVRNAKQARHGYQQLQLYGKASTISKTRKLPPKDFISYNERMTCDFIEEYFSTKDLELKFLDISIAEYIRAYSIISNESELFMKKRKIKSTYTQISINDVCISKTKKKWIYLFVEWGLTHKNAERIFDLLVFDKRSKDLFDCPLLKAGEEYIVIPSIASITDPSRALLSNLKSKKVKINIKGELFEEQIRTTLRRAGIQLVHLKKKDYECDAVFPLNNDLFFVEAKHLNDPTSYREYMRNLDEIHDAVNQLNRIVDYYEHEENLEDIKKRLGIDYVNKIYRVVVTNTSQGEQLRINGVYTIDDIGFSGYFLRRPPQKHLMHKEGLNSTPVFYEHYVGSPNSRQFINFIENNPFIDHYKRRIEYTTFDYTEQLGLKFVDYGVKVNTIVNMDKLTPSELEELNQLF
ncbi:hypothetical protein MNQ98_07065 [Paenibacillus sp. N3/727]|uniref:hypothetical protein n=1 Tax=Paenibacillus sp. N3/727 TaxID=2925845 RepID=UPI001F538AF4|nr:hypothetical protein [Paenibacillus sp. N3/727]UNK19785.1 hypothetical protein MNQ98_07065 [Paenibacillus sp. N3/727]